MFVDESLRVSLDNYTEAVKTPYQAPKAFTADHLQSHGRLFLSHLVQELVLNIEFSFIFVILRLNSFHLFPSFANEC